MPKERGKYSDECGSERKGVSDMSERAGSPSGIIIVNKDGGISSQGVVSRVKKLFGADKAGHTGTLDPLATGVLPVLVGRAVKASEFMLTSDKHYGATLLLGVTADTQDITGKTLTECDSIPNEQTVREAIARMTGKIKQTPPMYSALKVGGKKLYELARAGIEIEREPREVTIHEIRAERLNEREYYLDVTCSAGTYIRTLCADIGAHLGCGGVMKTLVRLSACGYPLSSAHTLAELEAMSTEDRLGILIPTEDVFKKHPSVILPDFFARLARSGLEIYQKKIETDLPLGSYVRLADKDGFFALGEVREFEAGSAIKPIRQF